MKKLYTKPKIRHVPSVLTKRLNDVNINQTSIPDKEEVEFDAKKRNADFFDEEEDDFDSSGTLYTRYEKLW